ncbi:aminoacylase 1-like protein 2 [Irpex rosettiformis]|uniref:Aminoacylase 1-like protein 2 n=1 Tax=Irpex rosettiformis TaxID=378272 RepID=A0ACB8U1J4_9APHY|nr:aminoacylase 1-like protein 2 [Irpex rosettiformis]
MSDFSSPLWEVGQELTLQGTGEEYKSDFFDTVQESIELLDKELRKLSLDISAHPELRFEERHAHDVLTAFMAKQGFEVTPHHLLETAWKATYSHGNGGRTIGVNSEMDALPGVGHACGHNLIAIAGVAVACAIKSVLQKHDISGKVVLLGTPGEEGGGGKVILLDKGAYEGMDVCLMCHPAPGPLSAASLSSCLAIQRKVVEYHGHTAHAALAPWEGQNALDAAVSAYTNIALLRQQVKPSHRIHGIFEGKDWAPNVIPDYAKMFWYVRGQTWAEVQALVPRVEACFKAASLATACKVDIADGGATFDLRQNVALGDEFTRVFGSHFGPIDYTYGISSASTDFGNITYALPALHPGFAIPTEPHGGNHTRAFAKSAASPESHAATLNVSKALAAVGARVLTDDVFFSEVKRTFEQDKEARNAT